MEVVLQDVRFGLRQIRRDLGFAAVAVLTLALAIGGNTVVFSIANSVLFRPLPLLAPERLVAIWETDAKIGAQRRAVFPPDFLFWRQSTHQVFTGVSAFVGGGETIFALSGQTQPESVPGAIVSDNFFRLLGVTPALGRDFALGEGAEAGESSVILSYDFWQREFAGDRSVLGRVLTLNERPYVVIGVMPASFGFPPGAQLWVPGLSRAGEIMNLAGHVYPYFRVIGRLSPQVTLAQAQAAIDALSQQLQGQNPAAHSGVAAVVVPLQKDLYGNFRPALLILMAAVGVVLLIGCANVASLLLGRAAVRETEIATRAALGADRWRLVRQLLTESLLLGVTGGAAGLLTARLSMRAFPALLPVDLRLLRPVRIDVYVLAFTAAVSVLAAFLFGAAPAVYASRLNLEGMLRGATAAARTTARGNRLLRLVVAGEVALTLTLVVGAGLLIRSFRRLVGTDLGLDPKGVLTMTVAPSPSKYPDQSRQTFFLDQVISSIKAIRGVRSVGVTGFGLPFGGSSLETPFSIEGAFKQAPSKLQMGVLTPVAGDLFRAAGIRLNRGRLFEGTDRSGAAPVAIVDETLAKRFWPGQDPIGKRLDFEGGPEKPVWREVVGVVAHVPATPWEIEPLPEIYAPQAQVLEPAFLMTLVIRTDTDALGIAPSVRAKIWAIESDARITNIESLDGAISKSIARPHFAMTLLGIFAAAALALAAVGIYGLFSYSLRQRLHEIGVRMALGATRRDILVLVMSDAAKLVAGGMGVGLIGALAFTQSLRALLFGLSPTDPAAYAVAAIVTFLTAVAASYPPARRGFRVEPASLLRYE